MQKDTLEKIPQNIKKYRLLNHLTQAQVAAALNLDTQYYAQLERGERNFTVEKLILLCSVLKVNIENIIEVSVSANKASPETLIRVSELLTTLTEPQLLLAEKLIHDMIPYT